MHVRRMTVTVACSVLMSALGSSVPVENTVDWVQFSPGSILEILSEFWLYVAIDVAIADYCSEYTCIE